MTKQDLLDVLADERDRLADAADGLELAQQAGCSPIALLALLVPGVGVIAAHVARAACASLNAGQIANRIVRLRQLVGDVEALAQDVIAADEKKLPELERRVLALVDALRDIDAVSQLADTAIDGASKLLRGAKEAAAGLGSILGFIFSPYGLALGVVGYLALTSRRG